MEKHHANISLLQLSVIVIVQEKMEFVECRRGGQKLCHNGYMYTKKACKKTRIRWECSFRKGLQCKGAATTSLQVNFTSSYINTINYLQLKYYT